MATPIITVDGLMQMWTYDVSHSRLLLRRNKGGEFFTTLDILFNGVEFMELPTGISSATIEEMSEAELRQDLLELTRSFGYPIKTFRLRGGGKTGYVIAASMLSHEDERGYSDASAIFKPGGLMRALAEGGYSS